MGSKLFKSQKISLFLVKFKKLGFTVPLTWITWINVKDIFTTMQLLRVCQLYCKFLNNKNIFSFSLLWLVSV